MGALQEITAAQAASAAEAAVREKASLIATVQYQNRWLSFNGRMLGVKDGEVFFQTPPSVDEVKAEDVLLNKEASLNFRLRSHRYFFAAAVCGPTAWSDDGGKKTQALFARFPDKVDRLERRAYERVEVPAQHAARASVWVGSGRPVYTGRMLNLSVGGFQVRTARAALNFFMPGDVATASLTFDPGAEPVVVETYFRHGTEEGTMSLLGFEFASLHMTPEGREGLETILAALEVYRQAH